MKTTKEKIEVMAAYLAGKTIIYKKVMSRQDVWDILTPDREEPVWDWETYEYVVSDEKRGEPYRAYSSTEELIQDYEARFGKQNRPKYTVPLIWIRSVDGITTRLYSTFTDDPDLYDFMLRNWTYLDGTPFGKLVE